MKRPTLIILWILLAGFTTSFAQSKPHNSLRVFFYTKSIFQNTGGPQKNTAGLQDLKTVLPLVTKKKPDTNQDLFTQLINWDCKIRVKLNDHFNFILTYN